MAHRCYAFSNSHECVYGIDDYYRPSPHEHAIPTKVLLTACGDCGRYSPHPRYRPVPFRIGVCSRSVNSPEC